MLSSHVPNFRSMQLIKHMISLFQEFLASIKRMSYICPKYHCYSCNSKPQSIYITPQHVDRCYGEMRVRCGKVHYLPYCFTEIISMVSCQKGPTRHVYAWQIGLFWQNTLDIKGIIFMVIISVINIDGMQFGGMRLTALIYRDVSAPGCFTGIHCNVVSFTTFDMSL